MDHAAYAPAERKPRPRVPALPRPSRRRRPQSNAAKVVRNGPRQLSEVGPPAGRGDLSIIAHPNSRNVVHDHFRFATWVGRPWPLNVEPLLWSKGLLPLESCNEWECIIGRSGGWGV